MDGLDGRPVQNNCTHPCPGAPLEVYPLSFSMRERAFRPVIARSRHVSRAEPRLDLKFIRSALFSLSHKDFPFVAQELVPAGCHCCPGLPLRPRDDLLDKFLRKGQIKCLSKPTSFRDLPRTVCERVADKLLGTAPALHPSLRGSRKLLEACVVEAET